MTCTAAADSSSRHEHCHPVQNKGGGATPPPPVHTVRLLRHIDVAQSGDPYLPTHTHTICLGLLLLLATRHTTPLSTTTI